MRQGRRGDALLMRFSLDRRGAGSGEEVEWKWGEV